MIDQDRNTDVLKQTDVDNDLRGPDRRHGPGPDLMGASTLIGDRVRNKKDEHLGDIEEIMLDTRTGEARYAVLSFGGVLGLGDKLFAVPWNALTRDPKNKGFLLNVEKKRLQDAPGFDRNKWPDMSDPAWANKIRTYYYYGRGVGSDGF
jgi:sporulation protein YlmC with PRC-barrel domain